MLRGHVFEKQLFSNNCFALFIDTFLGQQCGVINGCVPTKTSNNSISLTSGYFCVQGRFLQEDGGTTFEIDAPEENDLYCKLVCEIDLSKRNTAGILNQAYYKIVTDENNYPELTKGLITEEGTIYQYEFCQFKNTSAGITDFSDTREFLDFDSIYTEVRNTLNLIKTNAKRDINSITSDLEEGFNEWFVTIQDILDENTAGHLYNLINTKANKKKTWNIILDKDNWEQTPVYELTSDESIDNEKTYYTRTGSGMSSDPYVYTEVEEPDVEDIATYYEITSMTKPYIQTIEVTGILSTDVVNAYPIYSNDLETRASQKENYNKISIIKSTTDSIILECDEEAPEINLDIRLEVVY